MLGYMAFDPIGVLLEPAGKRKLKPRPRRPYANLEVLKQLVVADPFTGFKGTFAGFLRQYPNLNEVFEDAVKKLREIDQTP